MQPNMKKFLISISVAAVTAVIIYFIDKYLFGVNSVVMTLVTVGVVTAVNIVIETRQKKG